MQDPELLLPRRELDFQLYDLLDAESLTQRERYAGHDRSTFDAVLEVAREMARNHFLPLNRLADQQEPWMEDGSARVPAAFREAIKAYADAGFLAATQDEAVGGQQLPVLLAQAAGSLFKSACVALASYPSLASANANVIRRFGSTEQQQRYLPGLLSGRFLGTMALTEPQAGSSLADLRSRATPRNGGAIGHPDTRYLLQGQKIFISAGDHDLSENIVHLVLARLPDAPAGVRGLSLFIAPKRKVDADGRSLGDNDIALAGLVHKLGWRGTTSTVLSLGEGGHGEAELIGPPHGGLACMFQMMNEARIGVGLGAVMLGWRGYLASLDHARQRLQGRAPGERDASSPPLPLMAHADVRRMLLAQKAWVEGGYSLCLYAARLVDDQRTGTDAAVREEAGELLELLTPVVKAWPSQWCLQANDLALQIHGGYGYTREYAVEQFWRDNRLNPIHEGTQGIQALDLLGRKMALHGGAGLAAWTRRVLLCTAGARHAAEQAPTDWADELRAQAQALESAADAVLETFAALSPQLQADPRSGLANASVFLEAFGHTVVAWRWLEQALAALRRWPGAQGAERDFLQGKRLACRWFFRWELPRTQAQHELLRSFDDTTLVMPEASF